MWGTWTGPGGGPGSAAKVAVSTWLCGRRPPPASSDATLADRTGGPLFLTRWRSRTAPARRDVYAPTGQARLSYRTAAAEFGRHSGGWTLHQLRHSLLTHLAEAGASAVMLQAKSRHRDLRTLSVYTRPGVEAVARFTADQFDSPGGQG